MSNVEFFAVAWATPVRPLVGKTEHCVWGGETPAEQIRAASYAWWRRQGRTARAAVALMREDVATGTVRFPRHYPEASQSQAAYGEDRVRWIEDPETSGLRLVGLAHDVCSGITHRGRFLHPDGCLGEVVCGVIYQMSGKDGRARYLAGYADPWNSDETGRGPALVCLDPMVGARLDRYGARDHDYVLGSVAHRADRIAGRMAEEERDYRQAYEAGRDARQAGRDMREAAARYAGALRACRAVLRNRHGIDVADARLIMKEQIAHLRGLFARLKSARKTFRKCLETRHGSTHAGHHGWSNGYTDH